VIVVVPAAYEYGPDLLSISNRASREDTKLLNSIREIYPMPVENVIGGNPTVALVGMTGAVVEPPARVPAPG
jgi:hypothetical protein